MHTDLPIQAVFTPPNITPPAGHGPRHNSDLQGLLPKEQATHRRNRQAEQTEFVELEEKVPRKKGHS
jgi:hypothetical protein